MLMVAWREMTSGDRGVSLSTCKVLRSCSQCAEAISLAASPRPAVRMMAPPAGAHLLPEPLAALGSHGEQAPAPSALRLPCSSCDRRGGDRSWRQAASQHSGKCG